LGGAEHQSSSLLSSVLGETTTRTRGAMLRFGMSFKSAGSLLKGAVRAWVQDSVPRLGAALSYYTVFAISPLLVILIFVASLWFNQEAVRVELFGQVSGLIGQRGAATLESALTASMPRDQGIVASVLAASALLLTSTGLFMELQSALNTIFGVEAKPGAGIRAFLKNRLVSFVMVLSIGFLLLVLLVVSAMLSAVAKYVSALVPWLDVLWMILNLLVTLGVIAVLLRSSSKCCGCPHRLARCLVRSHSQGILFLQGNSSGPVLGKNAAVSAYGQRDRWC